MDIKQPKWKVPEYTKKEINAAGEVVRNTSSPSEYTVAVDVINNWRASHAYPLHVFYMNLRRIAGSRDDVIVAERLKRLESIVDKLKREEEMNLWRMNDLGGCRIVFPTVEEVFRQCKKFRASRIRHEFVKEYDYIQNPKTSGYRSIHLVYKFYSDKPSKAIYNQNMRIELQFRTHLQHIWATALETMGLYTKQALKSGKGSKEILRFFVLVSSLFALQEGCPVVPGTLADATELVSEIEQINNQYRVLDKLRAIRMAIQHEKKSQYDKRGYYILQLNHEKNSINIIYFSPSETEDADKVYAALEKHSKGKPIDVVLARADSFSTLRAAYPNYFMDIGEFVETVSNYLR